MMLFWSSTNILVSLPNSIFKSSSTQLPYPPKCVPVSLSTYLSVLICVNFVKEKNGKTIWYVWCDNLKRSMEQEKFKWPYKFSLFYGIGRVVRYKIKLKTYRVATQIPRYC